MRNPFKALIEKAQENTDRRAYEIASKVVDALEELLHDNKVTITINVEPKK